VASDLFVAKLGADGVWKWALRAGGLLEDIASGLVVSPGGDVYVTGAFRGVSAFGGTMLTSKGGADVFVARIKSGGTWDWVEQVGGANDDLGYAVAMGPGGDIYVSGRYENNVNFGTTFLVAGPGNHNAFVARLSANGQWLWARESVSSTFETVTSMKSDASGNVYVLGGMQRDTIFGPFTLKNTGARNTKDLFVVKLDPLGKWLWATNAGGSGDDRGSDLALDGSGGVVVAGSFVGQALFDTHSVMGQGLSDAFLAHLDGGTGKWSWVEGMTGPGENVAYGVSWDAAGGVAVVGSFRDSVKFGRFSHQSSEKVRSKLFCGLYDPVGKRWVDSFLGSSSGEVVGRRLLFPTGGGLLLAGFFSGSGTFGGVQANSAGGNDIFVWKRK
jgi:hypothetical protein